MMGNTRRAGATTGPPDAPPSPINKHAEIRRLLLHVRARAEAARLIALQTAAWVDQGDAGDTGASARAEMMLPVAKTYCAEAAVANADAAIQVLGGAGYVKEWRSSECCAMLASFQYMREQLPFRASIFCNAAY
jgi:alkylation response protein AidB-like acyl-CoA dehydrogenase